MANSRQHETAEGERLAGVVDGGLAGLPTGTVTFLFSDIEGSTRLLQELGSERYAGELELHRGRVRRAVGAHGGVELGTEGDAFFVSFARASDALGAARDVQTALAVGPIRVRIGIHTGEPMLVSGNYVGLDVHKAARICSAANGGQVLVSQTTRDLAGDGLHDLGEHRLKDLTAPERLFQLGAGDFPPLRTLRPTNLPVEPGPLLGRQRELAELLVLARRSRLVTLTGAGGSGKTRLALQLAGELSDQRRDGAWWIPLAAVADRELVLPSIAQALGARDGLRERLAGKQLLLLLDNLEQVLDAAPLIADLLGSYPDVAVIATSRERLAISFEQEYPVPPLDQGAAEELFVSRARQLQPDFEADETVGEICRRLDRLPLALELASTRVKLMSTAQMLDRLEQRLDLLTKGRRDAPDRQATMRATIGWSYDLLLEGEQAVFRGLGVFAGSFELEAAEAICAADLDVLQSLIEKSLLRRDGHGRFFLLELTREYALEQLHRAGEREPLRRRHADWYLQLATRANEHLQSGAQTVWYPRVHAETDNLRAVLAWSLEHDIASGIELAAMLLPGWRMHGQLPELVAWFERALANPTATDARTRAVGLTSYGTALHWTFQLAPAESALRESLRLFRDTADRRGEANALKELGYVAWFKASPQSPETAISFLEAALEIYRELGDQHGIEHSLARIGNCLQESGALELAAAKYEEALAIVTELGDWSAIVVTTHSLGDLALDQGDRRRAAQQYRKALEATIEIDDELGKYACVKGLACVAALNGDLRDAGRLWAATEALTNTVGLVFGPHDRARYERIITPLSQDQRFQEGQRAGRDLPLDQAVRELISDHVSSS